MFALKEHVDVDFVVKVPEPEKKITKKTRSKGTVGRINKPVVKIADKIDGSSVDSGRATGSSPRRDDYLVAPESNYSRDAIEDPPVSSFINTPSKSVPPGDGARGAKSSGRPSSAGGAGNKKIYPNRPKSAANPSKRYNAGRAFVLKQELPWNYDLSLPDRDLLTLERDAYIQSKQAAKEKREKKIGAKSEGNETPGVSKVNSRTRPVKSVSGTALNGRSKTVFALVGQKEKEALNKSVTSTQHSRRNIINKGGPAGREGGPQPLIDKYKVSREETGIHARPWDNSELPPERTSRDIRLVPVARSKLIPMTGSDHHFDVSYKRESALRATDSIASAEGLEDQFGKLRVRGGETVKKESSISAIESNY